MIELLRPYHLLCFVLYFFGSQIVFAQPTSLNRHELPADTANAPYSFFIGGHLHGPSNNMSGMPANTILAFRDSINRTNASFFLSLGDIFLVPERDANGYTKSFLSRLNLPFFNAVGNHDVGGDTYAKMYGESYYYSFEKQSELFVVLNTEETGGSIVGTQLKFLAERVRYFGENSNLKNLVVASHRPIWTDDHPRLSEIFKGNTESILDVNFREEILPLLVAVAEQKNVYWLSGSMGGEANYSILYHKEPDVNLHFVACAIRGLKRDAILLATADAGKLKFLPISLTYEPMQSLEFYDVDQWLGSGGGQGFNWRLLPYLTGKALLSGQFWAGACTALLFCIAVCFFIRSRKRRKNAKA